MSPLRIVCAVAVALAGCLAAFVTVRTSGHSAPRSGEAGGGVSSNAIPPHAAPATTVTTGTTGSTGISVVLPRSNCSVDSRAKTVTFRVALRNSLRKPASDLLLTSLAFTDSSGNYIGWDRLPVRLEAGEERQVVTVARYGPVSRTVTNCRVALGSGGSSLLTKQKLA